MFARNTSLRSLFFLSMAVLASTSEGAFSPAFEGSLDRDEAWADDLFFLVAELERLHPAPYHAVSQVEFEEAVSLVYDQIPDLTDDQIVLELMRLLGLHGSAGKEGHCGVWPGSSFGVLPIQLYGFDEGWYIVDVDSEDHASLVGARVVGIEGTPMKDVVEAVTPLISCDNETNLLGKLPLKLRMPELLCGLGITSDGGAATFELEFPDGSLHAQRLSRVASGRRSFWLPRNDEVLWLADVGMPWWSRVLEEQRALYVQFNLTRADDGTGQSLASFANTIVKAFHTTKVERLVLDIRSNGGGDNTTFHPLVNALRDDETINQRGALFCLIGRGTFSAAGNLVTVLERETNAILVGEPTGGGPNQYGDAETVRLPNHPDLMVRISTRYHEFDPDHNERLTHEPELQVPLTAKSYFAGVDPVLRRALDFGR